VEPGGFLEVSASPIGWGRLDGSIDRLNNLYFSLR
jgi:hypothetical protein